MVFFTCAICSTDAGLNNLVKKKDVEDQIAASDLRRIWLRKIEPRNDPNCNKYERIFAQRLFEELPDGLMPDAQHVCKRCLKALPSKRSIIKPTLQWIILKDGTIKANPPMFHWYSHMYTNYTAMFRENYRADDQPVVISIAKMGRSRDGKRAACWTAEPVILREEMSKHRKAEKANALMLYNSEESKLVQENDHNNLLVKQKFCAILLMEFLVKYMRKRAVYEAAHRNKKKRVIITNASTSISAEDVVIMTN
jgi:hypothetical protein